VGSQRLVQGCKGVLASDERDGEGAKQAQPGWKPGRARPTNSPHGRQHSMATTDVQPPRGRSSASLLHGRRPLPAVERESTAHEVNGLPGARFAPRSWRGRRSWR
jgi:hypothetical protein